MRGEVAVVGISEIDPFESRGRSPVGLMAEASRLAVADAGLRLSDIDGLFTASSVYYTPSLTFAEYTGLNPRYSDSTVVGGSSFEAHVGHAAAAIRSGLCDYALVTYGSTQRSDRGKLVSQAEWLPYEQPYGMIHPISPMALIAHRHMHEFGTTSEQLAEVAVSARKWALRNPQAPYRVPLTVDQVLASPMISSPLHKLDCCLVTDGGAALVLCATDRARDLPRPPVYVLGFGESADHRNISGMPDLTTTRAVDSAQRAYRMAGLTPADIDTANVYDAFTISLLVLLEDLGFVAKGEGGPFVASGAIAPGGSLALNTNGGGLSYCHPGMLGLFLLTEAVRQLRGDAGERQVTAATTALAHGMGLTLGAHATVILGTERAL
ncbi:acetyl-CoA acetyltransferase [Rhizomonospora bruguierae]|uniref:acetyl-CoA acetyltransferase n=1 Tax=Rhizomonospora bruguierae TaxID=1581705 RepID=UPI001BCB8611|nr:acetyl-CoA acetyltransferase [Micromonospora sp. NBRC 107566]